MAFVSQGFEDPECVAAAALALKFLCEFCGPMLVDYLSQLHPFYVTATASGSKIPVHERRELATAIAHVLSAVPVDEMLKALQMFTLPVAQRLHAIVSAGKPRNEDVEVATVKECQDLLDLLAIFLKFVDPKVKKYVIIRMTRNSTMIFFVRLSPDKTTPPFNYCRICGLF
jgi:transportin-3